MLGSRVAVVASLAALVALAGAAGGQSRSRVVGGTSILVQSAPWAAYMRVANGSQSTYCSATIIDSEHVVTAAHCVYLVDGTRADPSAILVRAGISSSFRPLRGDAEQDRNVDSVRVHPGYTGPSSGSTDDVAVLALSSPLDLSGLFVQAVALPSGVAAYPGDTDVGFAGFGRETPSSPATGSLNWLVEHVDPQGTCGDFSAPMIQDSDAVSFCGSASWGSVCSGDSGAGLVTSGPTPTLVGIVSAGQVTADNVHCAAGTRTIFTAVWPPEVLRFLQGNDTPPTAPRRTSSTYVRLFWDRPLAAGGALVCFSDRWDGSPAITYSLVDSTGRVLKQSSSGVFKLGTKNVGGVLSCRASATNAGGTAVLASDWVGTVAPATVAAPVGSKAVRRR
jgi:hypothetical protein